MSDTEESKTEFTKKTELEQLLSDYSPNLENEYLLQEVENRFTLFPIKIPKAYEMYKKAVATLWVVEDVPLGNDISDWENKLNDNERNFIKNVLAFFAGSDGIVLENLAERFMKDIQHPEIRAFYGFQIAIENIHSESYSIMLDNLVRDSNEKILLFNSIKTVDSIKKISNWAMKWIDSDLPFSHRVIAFCVVEGVFFSGAFASIFWLKRFKSNGRLFLSGLIKSNEFIARDEGQHVQFGVEIYKLLIF
jgi:ribonucleoside-diphosphate reductase subunit M2